MRGNTTSGRLARIEANQRIPNAHTLTRGYMDLDHAAVGIGPDLGAIQIQPGPLDRGTQARFPSLGLCQPTRRVSHGPLSSVDREPGLFQTALRVIDGGIGPQVPRAQIAGPCQSALGDLDQCPLPNQRLGIRLRAHALALDRRRGFVPFRLALCEVEQGLLGVDPDKQRFCFRDRARTHRHAGDLTLDRGAQGRGLR